MTSSPHYPVKIEEIRKHYDRLSFLYRFFWGDHIHHGYWERGESIKSAQIQLMERLSERARIPRDARVLDIGCGLGGSAVWLAEHYDCDVTGMTISPVQARTATAKAKARGLTGRVRFEVKDANRWQPDPESIDVIWVVESSEHFYDKAYFFERCANALKPGGVLAVCAWLRRDGPLLESDQDLVNAIAEAMMCATLDSLSNYRQWMFSAGLNVTVADDITRHVEPTWTYCSRIVDNFAMRILLRFADEPTRRFVRAFPLMKEAYNKGAMAFGLFVARKA
jgi:tocopherol O-methyltransferase